MVTQASALSNLDTAVEIDISKLRSPSASTKVTPCSKMLKMSPKKKKKKEAEQKTPEMWKESEEYYQPPDEEDMYIAPGR